MTGMVAPMVLDGPIKGDWFETYVGQVLVPHLRRGDVVIMDNLSSYKRASVRDLIEAADARLMFLPPHSNDFTPIEKAFALFKAMLRKAGERTVTGLWSLIANSSTASSHRNAPTTSAPAATIHTGRKRSNCMTHFASDRQFNFIG